MTFSPENYKRYTPIKAFSANSQQELKSKIDKYCEDVIKFINTPLKECKHCNGTGIIGYHNVLYSKKKNNYKLNQKGTNMILTKTITVKLTKRLSQHYRKQGYDLPMHPKKALTELKVNVQDAHKSCSQHIEYQCDQCRRIKKIRIRNLFKSGNSLYSKIGKTLCFKCSSNFRKALGMISTDLPCAFCREKSLNRLVDNVSVCKTCYKIQKTLGGIKTFSDHLEKIKGNNYGK